jgi:sugar/nucleoside kinase (ribokinase family)
VCVIGNLLTDFIVRGLERLPDWGREVQGANHTIATGGQAANLARALATLGVPVSVIGNVGPDQAGSRIVADLDGAGVFIDGVEITPMGSTAISVAMVRLDGERAFVSDFASLADFDEALVLRHWDLVRRATYVCLVGQFNLPSLDPAAAKRILAAARADAKTTVLDTGWDPNGWPDQTVEGVKSLLGEVDIFLPDADETSALTGESDPMAAAQSLEASCRGLTVVKLGAEGSLARGAGLSWRVPALRASVYDTVGAGDVFDAGFLYGHSLGWDVAEAMGFANATASIYVSRSRDRFASSSEVHELIPQSDRRTPHKQPLDSGSGTRPER